MCFGWKPNRICPFNLHHGEWIHHFLFVHPQVKEDKQLRWAVWKHKISYESIMSISDGRSSSSQRSLWGIIRFLLWGTIWSAGHQCWQYVGQKKNNIYSQGWSEYISFISMFLTSAYSNGNDFLTPIQRLHLVSPSDCNEFTHVPCIQTHERP